MSSFLRAIVENLRKLRARIKIKKLSKHNNIVVDKNILSRVKVDIQGYGNVVNLTNIHIGTGKLKTVINISIYGNDNEIFIDNISISELLQVKIGQNHSNFGKVTNARFEIGRKTTIESMRYITYNSNTNSTIGDDCMISSGVILYNSDGHPIMDKETYRIVNRVGGIEIGNHCWIGQNATILKNSVIPNNCIVGYASVVSGQFSQSDAIYAGNPARCVKTGVTWDSNGSKYGYIENTIS